MDLFSHHLKQLELRLKAYIDRKIAAVVKMGSYSASSADGKGDKIRGYETEGTDEEKYDYEGRRMLPFGMRSVPPNDTYGVWVGVAGGATTGVILAGDTDRYGPSDLAVGEVAIYNKTSGTLIKLDKDGNVAITSASGKLITINGSDHPLPKWNDFEAALSAALGTISPTNTGGPILTDGGTLMTQLATKLNTSVYDSSKAKNG